MFRSLCFFLLSVSMLMIIGCGITGTVTDEFGNGIEGMEVKIKSVTSQEATVTNSDGKYTFDFTMLGTYDVSIIPGNNLPAEYPECDIASQAATVSMEATNITIDFTLLDCFPGACCTGLNCTDDMFKADCESEETGGIFHDGKSLCSEVTCEAMGACCSHDTCTDTVLQSECETTMSGTFMGDGSDCSQIDCTQ